MTPPPSSPPPNPHPTGISSNLKNQGISNGSWEDAIQDGSKIINKIIDTLKKDDDKPREVHIKGSIIKSQILGDDMQTKTELDLTITF
jgi:hypothetical protein